MPSQKSIVDARPESAQDSAVVWSTLRAAHGTGLVGLPFDEFVGSRFHVNRRELEVGFEYEMVRGQDGSMTLDRTIDYEKVAKTLGATKLNDVPPEFELDLGPNHGGDFEVDGARYAIYVSGGSYNVRIFDATPDAVALILGEKYVELLTACEGFAIRKVCRTTEEIRVRLDGPGPRFAMAEAGSRSIRLHWKDGWLQAAIPEWARQLEFDAIAFGTENVACMFELPELSPPESCQTDE